MCFLNSAKPKVLQVIKERTGFFFCLLLCLLFRPGTVQAVKVELDAGSSTSSTSMSVGALVDSYEPDLNVWLSQDINQFGGVFAQQQWEGDKSIYARASASIDCSAQGVSPDPGVRYINRSEIYKVGFNPDCVADPGWWDPPPADTDPDDDEFITASFSCNLTGTNTVFWELLPTDEEILGDPVIVSFGPVHYYIGSYISEGPVVLKERLYDWTFGVLEREVFGLYEVTSVAGPTPVWEDLEIHAYIGDKIVLSYGMQSKSQSDETFGVEWPRVQQSPWGQPAMELSLAVSAMPAIIAPDVVGMTHLDAETTLDAAGFFGTGALDIPTCSDTVPPGHVIEQDPAAGTWVPYGLQGVLLKISGTLVPDVIGLNEAGAESSLNNCNLIKGTITYDCGESFLPSGIVIAQSEDAYTYVPCGSAVDLVISGAIVPDVIGMTETQAENSLNAAGLVKGSVTFAHSDVIPAGHVISQSPDPGTIVECSSVVDLVIAKEGCVVPDVLGMTEVEAEAALNAAGLIKGSVTYAYSDTVVAGTVMAQDPAAGTLLDCGSLVDLVVSLGSSGGGGGGGSGCTPPDAALLHPFHVGLRHVYNRSHGETDWTVERECIDKMTDKSMNYYLLQTSNYDNDGEYEYGGSVRSTQNEVYSYNPGGDDYLQFQRAPVGTTWTIHEPSDAYTYKVIQIVAIEEVTVPNGTFCAYKHRKYRSDGDGSVSPSWYEWIVPGVGIVMEIDYWTDNPPAIMKLVSVHSVIEEKILETLDFFDESVLAGTLVGEGSGRSAKNRLNALRHMLETAADLVKGGFYEEAREQLWSAYKKCDGKDKPPDFVSGDAADDLAAKIQSVIDSF